MPGDSLAVQGMPDNELLDILKIMCVVIGDPHESRKFDLQTVNTSNGHSCRIKQGPADQE